MINDGHTMRIVIPHEQSMPVGQVVCPHPYPTPTDGPLGSLPLCRQEWDEDKLVGRSATCTVADHWDYHDSSWQDTVDFPASIGATETEVILTSDPVPITYTWDDGSLVVAFPPASRLLTRLPGSTADEVGRRMVRAVRGALTAATELDKEVIVRRFGGLRPTIVCLCGSTRFGEAFRAANLRLTLAGNIVLSIGCDTKSDAQLAEAEALGQPFDLTKAALDDLHLRKIDLADRIMVLNVGGYIGESTSREIDYARSIGRPVDYLEEAVAPGLYRV